MPQDSELEIPIDDAERQSHSTPDLDIPKPDPQREIENKILSVGNMLPQGSEGAMGALMKARGHIIPGREPDYHNAQLELERHGPDP